MSDTRIIVVNASHHALSLATSLTSSQSLVPQSATLVFLETFGIPGGADREAAWRTDARRIGVHLERIVVESARTEPRGASRLLIAILDDTDDVCRRSAEFVQENLDDAQTMAIVIITTRGEPLKSMLSGDTGGLLFIVRVAALSPPAFAAMDTTLNRPKAPQFDACEIFLSPTGRRGALECTAMGAALGVMRHLRVDSDRVVPFVPLDAALATGLAVMGNPTIRRHHFPSPTVRQALLQLGAPTGGLVWGMVAEYIIDYLGRYAPEITKHSIGGVITTAPDLGVSNTFDDAWNAVLRHTHPLEAAYRRWSAQSSWTHLHRYPHSAVAERLRGVLGEIERECAFLISPQAPQRSASKRPSNTNISKDLDDATFADAPFVANTAAYERLIHLLAADPTLRVTALPFVDLRWVPWEHYVKRICVGALRFIYEHVLGMDHVHLPFPTPQYHNDLTFTRGRAPESSRLFRRAFPLAYWAIRGGQQPNGHVLPLQAGGHDGRRLAILAQPQVQLMISQLAREQGASRESIEERANAILRGIGDTLNNAQARSLASVVRFAMQTLFDRIHLNHDAERILFEASRTHSAVVLVPSHRSYMDFIVLSYTLLCMGLPLPHICAGEDFLRLGPLSEFLRGSGAFFMRRSFKGDVLYGGLFKEYVRHLVRHRQCVEFFIEGTRSRSGKTLAPKLGLLKMVTDAFFERQEEFDDVLFVPVGLSYDQMLEGGLYADELMGVPKPPETLGNLFRSASILRERHGGINVEVGSPISLAALAENVAATVATTTAPRMRGGTAEGGESEGSTIVGPSGSRTPPRALAALAWTITAALQNNIGVSPTALTAAALIHVDSCRMGEGGADAALVASAVEWVRAVVCRRGGKLAAEFAAYDGKRLVEETVPLLRPRMSVTRLSRVQWDAPRESTPFQRAMQLTICANQIIHLLCDEGILCSVVVGMGSATTLEGGASHQQRIDYRITVSSLLPCLDVVSRLVSYEFPNHRPLGCQRTIVSWASQALQRLHDEETATNPPLALEADEEVRLVRTPLLSFLIAAVTPSLEALWWMMTAVDVAASVKAPWKPTAVVDACSAVSGRLATLAGNFPAACIVASNKESLRNVWQAIADEGFAAKSPEGAFMLRKESTHRFMEVYAWVGRLRIRKDTESEVEGVRVAIKEHLLAKPSQRPKNKL